MCVCDMDYTAYIWHGVSDMDKDIRLKNGENSPERTPKLRYFTAEAQSTLCMNQGSGIVFK